MAKKHREPDDLITLFDLLEMAEKLDGQSSSREIGDMIARLQEKYQDAVRREEAEERKAQEEKKRRKEDEERRQHEIYVEEVTSMDLPLDWNNVFDSDPRTQGVHTDSISDALIICLSSLGRVDIEFISSITGADYKTVISTLKGSIYQNPDTWNNCFYQGWETADEYLSGNLIRKLETAKKANKEYLGYFADNIKAIEKVLPPTLSADDIYITLGSPWVPADIIDDFMEHLFGDPLRYWSPEYVYNNMSGLVEQMQTKHDEITGSWNIPDKSRYPSSVGTMVTYGTDRIGALHIIEKTLNMKTPAIYDEVRCRSNKSGKKRVLNQTETMAAVGKQKKLIKAFQDWVWTDKSRKKRLEDIYENKFGCVRKRTFDGSFLTFPGMSPSVQLYPYQKDAVARIIFTPNTLLAHDVGAGKTYVMVAAGQEMRRMGLSKKNLYVVPNNIVGQWRNIFLTLYPDAKLLCVDPKSFTPDKRQDVLRKMRDNDYDGIIIAYSCFDMIPVSKDYYLDELKTVKELVTNAMNSSGKQTAELKRKAKSLNEGFAEMIRNLDDSDEDVYFDELGVTRMFVDEAHNYKNVPLETQSDHVLGINCKGSKKCQNMMDKVHAIQKLNDGKGVIMATGTPITNSITDAYVMQKYLQSGELAMLDLQNFDSWTGMFAEKVAGFEIDVDTSKYRLAERFSKFHNLPELTSLLSSFADFHYVDKSDGLPDYDGHTDSLIGKTAQFQEYMEKISLRADNVRNHIVPRTVDNMLKITTDGRKAALDLRLVDSRAQFSYQSKVARCVENVSEIYFRTKDDLRTQIIFCDISIPKNKFNIYDELKDRLVFRGIPKDEIAFIHEAETDTKRAQLFEKVRKGEIRVLIGSTSKLGMGVNVQDKLVAIHHIDVPWRPADMTQREGRILRPGNTNKKIYIFRYITEGSFDAYSWQLLETKQHFISDLLSGSLSQRSGEEIESTILDYGEVKALAIGNPLVKKRVEAANELTRYITLQRKAVENRLQMEQELLEIPGRVKNQKGLIESCNADIKAYAAWKEANSISEDNTSAKKEESERRRRIRERLGAALISHILEPRETFFEAYRGFEIILPANLTMEKPFIYLKKTGKYYLELGSSEIGHLIRIDNFLDSLGEHLASLKIALKKLQDRELDIKNELAKNENYIDKIEEYKQIVSDIDKKLGVSK